jgi:hypothetical protein
MLESSFESLDSLISAFRDRGCKQLLVKPLSENQDNEKNQIYLATDTSLMTYFPGTFTFAPQASSSTEKTHSSPGSFRQYLDMRLHWLWPDGSANLAPETKAIFYFQYPELRLSGFIRGCRRAPQSLRREKMDEYGRRVLVLGFHQDDVFGAVVTDYDGIGLIDSLSTLPQYPGVKHSARKGMSTILRWIPNDSTPSTASLEVLKRELCDLAGSWQASRFLREGDQGPTFALNNQGSGWTLEALLGIPRNSRAEADKDGFEFKARPRTGPVTITTTEPDFGYRKEFGLEKFLHDFGRPGTKNDGSFRFTGKLSVLKQNQKSNAIVQVSHWDTENGVPDGSGTPEVAIIHAPSNIVLAGWNMNTLADKWSKKHSGCIYVDYTRFPPKGGLASHYAYGPIAYCGLGTSINLLLASLARGEIFFDPGDRIYANGEKKKRMQWRVDGLARKPSTETLRTLYNDWEEFRISDGIPISSPADLS